MENYGCVLIVKTKWRKWNLSKPMKKVALDGPKHISRAPDLFATRGDPKGFTHERRSYPPGKTTLAESLWSLLEPWNKTLPLFMTLRPSFFHSFPSAFAASVLSFAWHRIKTGLLWTFLSEVAFATCSFHIHQSLQNCLLQIGWAHKSIRPASGCRHKAWDCSLSCTLDLHDSWTIWTVFAQHCSRWRVNRTLSASHPTWRIMVVSS